MLPWRMPPIEDSASLVSCYDDLPWWSAHFGAVLLDTIQFPNVRVALDIGSGTGFPLVELAQRLGPLARVVGVDPWKLALDRIRSKLSLWSIRNVELVEGVAERLPWAEGTFDLVVSNNGFNNVADPAASFGEAHRVCRKGAQLVFTVNLPGTMIELYDAFRQVLSQCGLSERIGLIDAHIREKRKTTPQVLSLVEAAGFTVRSAKEHSFALRYASGTAMLNHGFIRVAFLPSWKAIVPDDRADEVLGHLMARLDDVARQQAELRMSVPFVCVDAVA